jgi:hypothetical protein
VSQGRDAKEGYKAEQSYAQFEITMNAHRVHGARGTKRANSALPRHKPPIYSASRSPRETEPDDLVDQLGASAQCDQQDENRRSYFGMASITLRFSSETVEERI